MVLGFMALMVIILAVATAGVIKALRGRDGAQDKESDARETKMIQEMHQGLMRMEQRIEALETILMETDGAQAEKEQT